MKNLFIILFITLFIAACDDKTEEVITNPTSILPSMTATVNGNEWKANISPAAVYDSDKKILSIIGRNTDNGDTTVIVFLRESK